MSYTLQTGYNILLHLDKPIPRANSMGCYFFTNFQDILVILYHPIIKKINNKRNIVHFYGIPTI